MEEIYKDLNSEKSKEFQKLLNSEFSRSKVEEGKIVEGTVTKITDKLIYIEVPGAKSEGILDINELKILKEKDNLELGSKISVLVERLEDKNGDLIISREKARKMKSWELLEKAFEQKKEVNGQIISKIKGGFIVSVQSSLCFLPGSQVDLKPLKDISHLMKEPQRFMIVKCDRVRGNIVLSRRAILEGMRDANKEEIINKFKEGQIVEGTVKGITAYGVFFDLNNGCDCMTHINECSWSRIGHPEELFTIGQKQKLKIIKIDHDSKKISTSVKMLTPDPFETKINNYKVGKIYGAECKKITDYGIFLSLEDGIEGLLHASECSHTKKNVSVKKMFSISQKIDVMVKEIDIEKRRISLSYKDTIPNPWEKFKKEFPVGSKVEGAVKNITDFALFVSIKGFEIDGMIHFKDISHEESEEELKKFKKNDLLTCQVIEASSSEEKIRLGLKQLLPDPFDYFKDKNKNDIITVIVHETQDTAIRVRPDGCSLKFIIKKNKIAVNKEDQRTSRFNRGDKIDCMIEELDTKKRKASLSIKLLEQKQTREAIKKYGSADSGKSLPFAGLTEALNKKRAKKTKEEK